MALERYQSDSKEKEVRWSRHNILKRMEPPKPIEVIEFVEEMANNNLMYAANLALIILLAARSGEVNRYTYNYIKNPKTEAGNKKYKDFTWKKYKEVKDENPELVIPLKKKSIQVRDVEAVTKEDGTDWIKFSRRIEKYKIVLIKGRDGKKTSHDNYKPVYLPLDSNFYLHRLLLVFNRYWDDKHFDDADGEKELFPYGSESLRKYMWKNYKLPIHIFREWRIKFMVDKKYEGFGTYQLCSFIGWKTLEVSKTYAESSEENITDAIDKSIEKERLRKIEEKKKRGEV